jgi:hypothetical protein
MASRGEKRHFVLAKPKRICVRTPGLGSHPTDQRIPAGRHLEKGPLDSCLVSFRPASL